MSKREKLLSELADAQDNYIKLLAKEIGKNIIFLSFHGIHPSDEAINDADVVRSRIDSLKEELGV